jgi:DNA-binding SARP family transcriptional activator
MRFGLLGTLEVVGDGGEPVDVGGSQPRMLLAMLLAASGRIVPVDALIEAIWGECPPGSAAGTLQSYVSRLRRGLEPERERGAPARVLVWEPPGYRLDVDPGAVDFRRFERLADEGRDLLEDGSPEEARERLVEAVALWRGRALLEFADEEFARGIATRLEERRIVALEDRLAADLALGRHTAVVGELTELVREHPLRETSWGHLALALYRSGRQADALRALEDMRRTLRDELGVEPSPPLRAIEGQILDHDDALDLTPRPARASQARTRAEAGAPSDTTLIGRRAEMEQLVHTLDEAFAGRTRFAIVQGEPGIGKTRLLEELSARATERGAAVHWGRCHETGAAPVFWPWLEVLRGWVESAPGDRDDDDVRVERLLAPTGNSSSEPPPGDSRFQLYDAIARTVGRSARLRPMVIVLDDVQWADPASLELLDFLAGRSAEVPALIAVSVRDVELQRDSDVTRALGTGSRRPGTRRITLRGLAERDTVAMIRLATGWEPSRAVADAIHERAEGNPFFVAELARLVAFDPSGDDELVHRVEVPAGVRDVVRRRLATLPDPSVELLAVGAVLGRAVPLDVLAAASGRDVETCLDELEPALASRLLEDAPDAPATYRFAHALVREVLLDELPASRRTRLHLRAADAIAAVRGDTDDDAELVAAHLWSALPLAPRARTAAALERAADVAIRRVSYESAEQLLERAAQLRRSAGGDADDGQAELLTIHRLLGVRRVLYSYMRSLEVVPLDRALELARRTDRLDVLEELLWAEWAAASTACEFAVAEPLAARLLALGRESESDSARSLGFGAWGIHCWHVGRITEACEHLDAAVAVDVEHVAFTSGTLSQHRMLAECFDVMIHELAGDIDDGEARFAALAARQTDPFGQVVVWSCAAYAGLMGGDAMRAARAGRRGCEHDPDLTFPFQFFSASSAVFLAGALTELGDHEEALEIFAAALPHYVETGVRTVLPAHHANHALALQRAGRVEEALKEIAVAEDVLDRFGERWNEPYVLMRKAEILTNTGDAGRAEVRDLLTRAVTVATEQGAHRFGRRGRALAKELGVSLR